jgi:hypothetical protein
MPSETRLYIWPPRPSQRQTDRQTSSECRQPPPNTKEGANDRARATRPSTPCLPLPRSSPPCARRRRRVSIPVPSSLDPLRRTKQLACASWRSRRSRPSRGCAAPCGGGGGGPAATTPRPHPPPASPPAPRVRALMRFRRGTWRCAWRPAPAPPGGSWCRWRTSATRRSGSCCRRRRTSTASRRPPGPSRFPATRTTSSTSSAACPRRPPPPAALPCGGALRAASRGRCCKPEE